MRFHALLLSAIAATAQATVPDDTVLVGNGTGYEEKAVPDCPDEGGNHLNYDSVNNSFYCGTSGNESVSGTFIGTATGFTTSPTAYYRYTIVGDLVTVCQTSDVTGTSNSSALTITGVPAILMPKVGHTARTVLVRISNNGVTSMGVLTVQWDETIFRVYAGLDSEPFAASGTKRLRKACMSWNRVDE
jgi:hypothetical protein